MILVDMNQVMISNMMAQLGSHKNAQIDQNMIRHMVLNSLRSFRSRFSDEFGELIICCDDRNYWRREVFPYYKASRRESRQKSEMDWNAIFESLNAIRDELKEFFPYRVFQIDGCEADDIIGTIVHKEGTILNSNSPILVLSGDKDYIQLHQYGNVKQYDPTRKRWIGSDNPEQYLSEHIIKGDSGDGVPNILSQDNCMVVGIRQSPMTKKRLAQFSDINNMNDDVKRNYFRNKMLIDLSEIPEHITAKILTEYGKPHTKDRSKLFNYFVKNKLKHLMSNLQEF